jgi:hypothetical protein
MADGKAFPVKRCAVRFLAAFAVLLAVFYAAGPLFARLLLPVMEAEMRLLRPAYRIELTLAGRDRIEYRIDVPFPGPTRRESGRTASRRKDASRRATCPSTPSWSCPSFSPGRRRRRGRRGPHRPVLPLLLVELLDFPFTFYGERNRESRWRPFPRE